MKKLFLPVFFVISILGSVAQTASVKPVTPPVLTADQKLAYFKANSEYQTASAQAQQASQAAQQKQVLLSEAVKSITDACGKDFNATMDAKGDPACVAKPEAPKTPVEPKK